MIFHQKFNLFTVKELFVHFIRMIIRLLLEISVICFLCLILLNYKSQPEKYTQNLVSFLHLSVSLF